MDKYIKIYEKYNLPEKHYKQFDILFDYLTPISNEKNNIGEKNKGDFLPLIVKILSSCNLDNINLDIREGIEEGKDYLKQFESEPIVDFMKEVSDKPGIDIVNSLEDNVKNDISADINKSIDSGKYNTLIIYDMISDIEIRSSEDFSPRLVFDTNYCFV